MKNKISTIYNIFKEYDINLYMFFKVLDIKEYFPKQENGTVLAMIILAEVEIANDITNKYVITNGSNLFNMYREEHGDIVNSREQELNKDKASKEYPTVDDVKNWIYCDYTEEEMNEKIIERLEKIVLIKVYMELKKHDKNVNNVILIDTNENILFKGKIKNE